MNNNEQTSGINTLVQPVSTALPVINVQEFWTPIQVATKLGKAPQYIYGLLRGSKIPAEHIMEIPKGDGTMRELLLPTFFTWFESRGCQQGRPAGSGSVSKNVVVTRQATVDELMVAMATKLEASGNKKFLGLADALKTACVSAIPAGPEPAASENAATTVA